MKNLKITLLNISLLAATLLILTAPFAKAATPYACFQADAVNFEKHTGTVNLTAPSVQFEFLPQQQIRVVADKNGVHYDFTAYAVHTFSEAVDTGSENDRLAVPTLDAVRFAANVPSPAQNFTFEGGTVQNTIFTDSDTGKPYLLIDLYLIAKSPSEDESNTMFFCQTEFENQLFQKNVILSASIESGYVRPEDQTSEACSITNDGTVIISKEHGMDDTGNVINKVFKVRSISQRVVKRIQALTQEISQLELTKGRYPCDGGSGELKGYLDGAPVIVSAAYDCGGSFSRKDNSQHSAKYKLNSIAKKYCGIDVANWIEF